VRQLVRQHSRFFLLATLAAFGLRLLFLFRFPEITTDSFVYGDIAKNWLQHGIYGLSGTEEISATYIRLPGYPAFLAAIFAIFGMEQYRAAHAFDSIAYGVNKDDQGDFRPGQQAARQHQVLAPLLEAELGKAEIREMARQAGLRVWDKPASACLSSRIEYGRPVTAEALQVVERGEDSLRALGFRQFRVRHHGDIVRIEIAREELPRAMSVEMAREFTSIFRKLGFKFVTLDLEGFRSGSMNSLLSVEELNRRLA